MNRVELIEHIGKTFPKGFGMEVGVLKGEFSKEILNVWGGTLFMVDTWKDLQEEYQNTNIRNYEEVMHNVEGYEDRAIMIRASSKIASTIFQDRSLDFVYIDANHTYECVKEDIELWYPKVKIGGYLCGHDYLKIENWWNGKNFAENNIDKHIWFNYGDGDKYHGPFGVNPAVDDFCRVNNYALEITEEWFGSWVIQKNK